jgi:hypothetical protein
MTRAKVVALLGLGALVALGSSCSRDATAEVSATPGAGPPSGSGTYDDLVALYREFRTFQEPAVVDRVADYSDEAMAGKRQGIEEFRGRLADMNVTDWSRPEQVDYLVVRSVVDGYEFRLEVLKPWARDPGFYVDQLMRVAFTDLPVSAGRLENLQSRLRAVPRLLESAVANLDQGAADYARLALHNLENADGVGHGHPYREIPPAGILGWYEDFRLRAAQEQPELEADIRAAQEAVRAFHGWLQDNGPLMTAAAGVGRERFNWYLKHVKLMPYTVDELLVLGQREFERLTAFLALERHRNRDLPELEPAASGEEYQQRIADADRHIRGFLVEEEILTVPEDIGGLGTNVPWIVRPGGRNFWEEIQYRDPRPDHVHAVIPGHRFDGLLAARSDHPIRSRYTDGARVEGWGYYLEEALMQAGLLDDLPRTRELYYLFGIKRAVRVYADIMMQLNQIDVDEAVSYMVERVPFLDDNVARVDAEIYLRRPPGYGLSYMIGGLQIEKLLADRARQLGDDFALGRFHDDFLAAGRIPVALIRWEMTGRDDEVAEFWKRDPL